MDDIGMTNGQGVDEGPQATLDAQLCHVGGLNQNYTSSAGTLYHVQVEDRGPLLDRVTERPVRRINVVIYANYGESTARVIHSHDHDLPDVRTQGHNRLVQQSIQDLALQARAVIEEKEQRQVMRIKCLIREYYYTKDETAKREFEEANLLFPFLFSRAWRELREERQRASDAPPPAAPPVAASAPPDDESAAPDASVAAEAPDEVAAPDEVTYPLEEGARELVLEIERIIIELGRDLHALRLRGGADDILLQTCRKLVMRAKESISGRQSSEFSARRLDMTRNSLMTTWRQVRSRLRTSGEQ
jgi:hypothetical protein